MRMSDEKDALLPTATLSSPVLMMQSRMIAFVSARSIASVLCDAGFAPEEGAKTLARWIVTLPALPLIEKNGDGELETVMSWIKTRLQAEKVTMFGREIAE